MSERQKWSCEYCTYENYNASKKCVLCRASKPVKIIEPVEGPLQDIYQLANAAESSTAESACASHNPQNRILTSSRQEAYNKWCCEVCTYLNWPKSLRCVQCLSQRPLPCPEMTVDDLRRDIPSGPSNCRSPTSPEEAKEFNNDRNRSLANAYKLGKWSCRACTYENWPKSTKCVLCGTGRTRTPEGASGGQDDPQDSFNTGENLGATASHSREDSPTDRLVHIRPFLGEMDRLWLGACNGVLDSDVHAVEAYICCGGDPGRKLTKEEARILNKAGIFECGFTLIHLAVRLERDEILAALLTSTEVATKAVKRVPCHLSPDLAASIQRHVSQALRQRKGDFPCFFLTECPTFMLPADIEELPPRIQTQLFDDLIDKDVQQELEMEEAIINWNLEVTGRLGSRLLPLWNRTAGDCLLDSVMQSTWGIFDRENVLRRSLSDSLTEGAVLFYPRWKESETLQASSLHFSLDETQWQQDWATLLSLASQPGTSLERTHVFALAHILRRPIIVYGVKFVKSFRGEVIGYAGFQGVYLPLLWEQSFCWKTPIILGYTRGHFSALVPLEQDNDSNIGATNNDSDASVHTFYLPLVDSDGKLLTIHFLNHQELGREEDLLKDWLDCCWTEEGVLVARMKIRRRRDLVRTMVDEWLDYYRRLSHTSVSTPPRTPVSSDGESDDE